MIGVFDSGAGGIAALLEIRRRNPFVDICFFADYENAPYGTKKRGELINLVTRDILKLKAAGAEKILMACCTASTIHKYLPENLRDAAIPIINATAREAAMATKNGRVGVIGTNATVSSGAFKNALSDHREIKYIRQLATQQLVGAVESGICDGNITPKQREALFRALLPLRERDIDTLILGCTHFARLEREISGVLPGVAIINSSREGAKEILKYCTPQGCGKTVYL